jgi:hypothetical protein
MLALMATVPAGAQAAEKGLMTDLTWGISDSDAVKTAADLQTVGAQWVRLDINWHDAEPVRGQYDPATLAMTDNAVGLARAAGVQIVMLVADTPTWESGSTNPLTQPSRPADYAKFVQFISARYAGKIAAYEIWNEENTARFWPSGPAPAQYANLLEAAYPAVKAGDPSAAVVFGGLSFNDYRYLEGVYAAAPDIGRYFDVMATHPYTNGAAAPEDITRDPDGRISEYSFPAYREVRAAMLAHGDDKPIWFTEFGWSTTTAGGTLGGVSEQTQADYLTRAYKYIEADPYVQVAITYNFRNNYWANDANDWDDQLGLMHTDFSPKPAFFAFQAYHPPGPTALAGVAAAPNVASPDAAVTTNAGSPAQSGPAHSPAAAGGSLVPVGLKLRTTTTLAPRTGVTARVAPRGRVAARCPARLVGTVTAARSGSVAIDVERAGAQGWRWTRTLHAKLTSAGRFSSPAPCGGAHTLRVRAVYGGSAKYSPSASGYVYVTGRRRAG